MHWCQDETLAVMSGVPVVGFLFRKAHKWYHNKTHHKCHHEGCESEHAEHLTSDGEVMLPNPEGWEAITSEEVDAKFGELVTIFLMFDRRTIKSYTFPETSEFEWFMAGDELKARWKNKFFSWDGSEWKLIPEMIPLTKEEQFDKAVSLLRQFMANDETYQKMLNFEKTEAYLAAEKFLESL